MPRWFFEEATDRQLNRIAEDGLTITGGRPSKGQASDIIGLFEPAEDHELEVLKFFKISRAGMNQTRARHEVARLFAEPASTEAWENRPATPIQREFYRFMGWKVPKGLTHKEAQARENEADDSYRLDEWIAYSNAWDDLCDADTRETYEIKKPSLSLFRTVWSDLRAEGHDHSDLEDDIKIVVDKLVDHEPDLQRDT